MQELERQHYSAYLLVMRTANPNHRWMYDTFEDPKATENEGKIMAQDSDSRSYSIEHRNSTKPESKTAVEESRTQKVVT